VLIKATLEAGGWETLQKSLPWVRGLLGILTKPDPPSTKKLCLITLTRIFVLTREYPTLIREITTPSLPAYIQSCLQLLSSKPSNSLLETVLESFNQLLPRHPTVFRSYVRQLKQILARLLAPTPSNKLSPERSGVESEVPYEVSEAARRLYVQLPSCAPKGASSEEWGKMVKDAVANAHRVADKVFRAVVEDWHSSHTAASTVNGHTLDDEVQDLEQDLLDLPPWSGIYAGSERLLGVLRILREYLANPTPGVVNLPIGLIMDLITRIFSLCVPAVGGSQSLPNSVRFNNQVSKDEREHLWVILPQFHVATMNILTALFNRLDDNASGLDHVFLDHLVWVFGAEKNVIQIRASCYVALAELLLRSGPALPKSSIDSLSTIIRYCCDDIISMDSKTPVATSGAANGKGNGGKQQQVTTNADAFLNSPLASKTSAADNAGLKQAASRLLPVLLSSIRAQHLSDSLRTRIDRTAILARHKDAMVASVLNPPPSKKFGKPAASILPLLSRSFAHDSVVESLLRPRMPVVRTGARASGEDPDEDTDVDVEDGEDEAVVEDEHFVGEELDTLLESASQSNMRVKEDAVSSSSPAEAPQLLPQRGSPSHFQKQEVQAAEPPKGAGQGLHTSKRLQTHDTPPSPAKRIRLSDTDRFSPIVPELAVASAPQSAESHSAPVSVQPEVVHQPSTAASKTTAIANNAEADEDDDDDFGELVLGQDTDEETDS
jgi:hypothetical protein